MANADDGDHGAHNVRKVTVEPLKAVRFEHHRLRAHFRVKRRNRVEHSPGDDAVEIALAGVHGVLEPRRSETERNRAGVDPFLELSALVVDAVVADHRRNGPEPGVGRVDAHDVEAFEEKLETLAKHRRAARRLTHFAAQHGESLRSLGFAPLQLHALDDCHHRLDELVAFGH